MGSLKRFWHKFPLLSLQSDLALVWLAEFDVVRALFSRLYLARGNKLAVHR